MMVSYATFCGVLTVFEILQLKRHTLVVLLACVPSRNLKRHKMGYMWPCSQFSKCDCLDII